MFGTGGIEPEVDDAPVSYADAKIASNAETPYAELSRLEQAAAHKLGATHDDWDDGTAEVWNISWEELDDTQKKAAASLGGSRGQAGQAHRAGEGQHRGTAAAGRGQRQRGSTEAGHSRGRGSTAAAGAQHRGRGAHSAGGRRQHTAQGQGGAGARSRGGNRHTNETTTAATGDIA